MDSKPNQIMIGIILFLIGVCLMTQNSGFNFSSLLFFFVGIAFVLLFITKRKSWALVVGVYLSWYAASDFIAGLFGNISITLNFSYATFFIVTAIIFFVFYYTKRKTGLLIPASILSWFGIYAMLSEIGILQFFNVSGLFLMICIGMAFFTAYFLGRGFIGRWAFYTGGICILAGILLSFGYDGILSGIKVIASTALILGSLIIILRAIRKQ